MASDQDQSKRKVSHENMRLWDEVCIQHGNRYHISATLGIHVLWEHLLCIMLTETRRPCQCSTCPAEIGCEIDRVEI